MPTVSECGIISTMLNSPNTADIGRIETDANRQGFRTFICEGENNGYWDGKCGLRSLSLNDNCNVCGYNNSNNPTYKFIGSSKNAVSLLKKDIEDRKRKPAKPKSRFLNKASFMEL